MSESAASASDCSHLTLKRCRQEGIRLEGQRVFLELFNNSHLTPAYISWLNDPEATRYTRHGESLYTLEKAQAYLADVQDSCTTIVFAVRLRSDFSHVGNIAISGISWENRSAEIAILLGESKARGNGIGFECVKLIRDFGFSILKLHRIKMGMTTSNAAMNRIAEKAGFQKEGLFREALYKNGVYLDIVQWAQIAS